MLKIPPIPRFIKIDPKNDPVIFEMEFQFMHYAAPANHQTYFFQ